MRRPAMLYALPLLLAAALPGALWGLDAAAARQEPDHPAPAAVTGQIWVDPGEAEQSRKVWLDIEYSDDHSADQPVTFDCRVNRYGNVDRVELALTIRDAGRDGVQFTGRAVLSLLDKEDHCRFVWDASGAPVGLYVARFGISTRVEYELGYVEMLVRKTNLEDLQGRHDAIAAELGALQARLAAAPVCGPSGASYLAMRLALAEDFVGFAADDLRAGAWRRAAAILRYLRRAIDKLRASAAFAPVAPELTVPVTRPGLAHIEAEEGVLTAGGAPVFLLGSALPAASPEAIARLSRYGLNFAAVSIAPGDTLPAEDKTVSAAALLEPLFEAARAHNVALAVDLAASRLPGWALDKWPELVSPATGQANLREPKVRALVAKHLEAVLPYLAQQDHLCSVSLLDHLQFQFRSEEVRQGFLKVLRETYPDRHALNRSWKSHLATLEDIDISGHHRPYEYQEKPAFQYDWQRYHQTLIDETIAWLLETARAQAPDLPYCVTAPDTVFDLGESRITPDRAMLAARLDYAGCRASNTQDDPFYEMGYPQEALYFTLLRSLAPAKPVVNLEHRLITGEALCAQNSSCFIHTALWDAAVSGMSASAAAGWTEAGEMLTGTADLLEGRRGMLACPACLEGYTRACLDLNRLAPIVAALQRAVADVAVVWSESAKIFCDGDPYLGSARDAFEGSSFCGYKVRFITEDQIAAGGLAGVKALVVPETPALTDAAFQAMQDFIANGGVVARIGTPIPYNEHGHSRHDAVGITRETIVVRGINLPTEYLHGMDGVFQFDALAPVPRAVNAYGYPLEGVKTRYVELEGTAYLYLVNLRDGAVTCHLPGGPRAGRDLIAGRDVAFPLYVEPLHPLLIRLDPQPAPDRLPEELPEPPAPAGPPIIEVAPIAPAAK